MRVLLRHNANVGKESCQGWAGTCRGRAGVLAGDLGRVSNQTGGPSRRAPFSSSVTPVLQEAVSTGDPEMVQVVLQYRDYQRARQRLAGIPELLNKLRQVQRAQRCGQGEGWRARAGGWQTAWPSPWSARPGPAWEGHPAWAACFPSTAREVPPPPFYLSISLIIIF